MKTLESTITLTIFTDYKNGKLVAQVEHEPIVKIVARYAHFTIQITPMLVGLKQHIIME